MLKRYILKYKVLFFTSVLLTAVAVWSALYQPRLIADVVNGLNEIDLAKNDAIAQAAVDDVNNTGIIMIIVGLIGLVAGVVNTIIAARLSQNIGSEVRSDLFNTVQNFGYSDIEKFSASNLVVRMTNDVTQVQNFIMMFLQMVVRVPLMFLGAFILALLALPSLWWTIIIYVVIVGLVVFTTLKIVGPSFAGMQKSIDSVNTSVKENLDGVRVVKSFATEEVEQTKLESKVDVLTKHVVKIGYGFSTLIPLFLLVANMLTAFVIYYVAKPAIDDPSMIGDMVSFINYLLQISFAIMMFGFVMMILGRATVSIGRINEVLNTKSTIIYGDETLNKEASSIEFKNVDFVYPNSEEVILKGLNFKVEAGKSVGIVGSTASGKTSLVNLIPRLYDPTNGEILINGKNLKQYNHKTLTDNISLVLQKPQLISGTIEQSIKEGNENASDEQLLEASKNAQAYEFISQKEGQFEGEVLQKGNNFSGGQKQRLSIARGFIKEPSILILDDSTSALDAKSENLVKTALNEKYKNMTKIIVSQKISSVVDLDEIIVLNEGQIDSIGTHSELLKTSEVYREIYSTQKGKEVATNE